MAIVAPSILSADFSRLGEEIKSVESAGADWIHVDVMDGHFVPNITIGPPVVKSLRAATKLPLDVHLMIEDADRYIPEFAAAGADIITIHQEACVHLHRSVTLIKELGKKAGVAINPATPVQTLLSIIGEIDLALIMSVNPGFGGQSFIESALGKVAELKGMIEQTGSAAMIEIDGGVTGENCHRITSAGADALVAGSAVFRSGDYGKIISTLRNSPTIAA